MGTGFRFHLFDATSASYAILVPMAVRLPTVKGSPISQRQVPSGWRRATSMAYSNICRGEETFPVSVHERDIAGLDHLPDIEIELRLRGSYTGQLLPQTLVLFCLARLS
jgi:hypothetical protein